MSRIVRVVLALVCVLAVATSAHIMFGAYGPRADEADQQSMLNALESAIDDGAANQAQELFPEGAFFMHALTGLSEARLGTPDDLARARTHLAALRTEEMVGRFGTGMVPENGIFAAGWTLDLAVTIAAQSSDPADQTAVTTLANEVADALEQSDTPFLASYPGQFWPCDTVVAVAALTKASKLTGLPTGTGQRWFAVAARWLATVPAPYAQPNGNPHAFLFPHRTNAQGQEIDGPRGTSQAIIQTYWPAIVGNDAAQWQGFVDRFVVRRAGLVGVVEYPDRPGGLGDVDSGPLIAGVSLSATAVVAGAARAHGDTTLARDLFGQAEVFGLPSRLGPRRYGFGLVPVGEAFLVNSMTQPRTNELTSATAPRPLWPGWWLPGLVIGAGCVLLLLRRANSPQRSAPRQTSNRQS